MQTAMALGIWLLIGAAHQALPVKVINTLVRNVKTEAAQQRTVRQLEAVLVLPFLLCKLKVQPFALLLFVALCSGRRPALAAGNWC